MENNEQHPQKVVIVAGPSFGSALSFMLFGAVLGAAGAWYLQNQKNAPAEENARFSAEAEEVKLAHRLAKLARRVKSLAGHAKDAAETVAVYVAPVVRSAIEEGKKVAHLTSEEIKQELESRTEEEPDDPAISKDQA